MGTFENNVGVLVHVLEAAAQHAPTARILLVTSSEVYGRAPWAARIDEDAPLLPENPYAVSKATQDLLGYQYFVGRNLAIVRVRPFNHIGPGQSDRFVTASFARQIAEIERGFVEPVLRVGNLDARRDFTDVRDVVRAYTLALEEGAEGQAYNVGRGEAHSIQEILDRLLARSSATIRVERDAARMRPVDAPVLVCDASRLRLRTGWEPRIALDQTLDDLLTYWRARVAAK
jgi:GDP-4-dehydro-6-deoxy-D-mannose reductase